MTENLVIQAQNREKLGKRSAKFYRSQNQVLAVMYGAKAEIRQIIVPIKTINQVMSLPDCFNRVLNIKLGNKEHMVILHAVDRDVVNNGILHLDFLQVAKDEYVTIRVPIVPINKDKCVGLKTGGVLNVVMRDLELVCLATEIPNALECDLSNYHVGDSIHIKDLTLPKNVKPVQDMDETIMSITSPQAEEAEKAEAAEITEEETDGADKS